MIQDQEFERLFRKEFKDILPNTIWQNDDGVYEVFGKYYIIPQKKKCQVLCHATEVGTFNSTRSALSWCIADKFQNYTLAREILAVDNALNLVVEDISIRASVADLAKNPDFRENIATKLETKIIRKKELENQLAKCISCAKYYQQRGFNNETARTGRNQPNKTSR
jgi:hypothetical protein